MFDDDDKKTGLSDIGDILADVFNSIWKRKIIFISLAFLICVVAWPVITILPDKYESKTRVYVDTQSMLRPLLRGIAVESDITQQFAYVTRRTLLSRPNMEKVLRETDLDLTIKNEQEKERLMRNLQERIEVEGQSKENIYTITFHDKDPQLAYNVVKVLLDVFIETSLTATRSDNDLTQQFLNEQLKVYESRLVEAEEKLKDFKRKNLGLMPNQFGDYFSRLSTANNDLKTSRLHLLEARQRRDELRKQLRSEEEFLPAEQQAAQDPELEAIKTRLRSMQNRLDELQLQYTDRHPNVISVKQAIEGLIKQQDERLAQVNKQVSENITRPKNPVYQELKIEFGRSEAEVAALEARLQENELEVAKLKELVDTIPQVEAELARLNRDYNVNRTNYEQLLERRESAKISREAEQSADQVQFKLLEPPKVPLVPLGPNRPLFFVLSMIFSLFLSGTIMWLIQQVKPTIDSLNQLKNLSDYPVYGTVSYVMGAVEEARRKKEIRIFVSLLVLMFGLFIFLLLDQSLKLNLIRSSIGA